MGSNAFYFYTEAEKKLDVIQDTKDFDYLIRLAKWNDHKGDLDTAIKIMEQAKKIAEETKKEDIKLSYHIVADAFRDEKNAEQIYKKLLKEGYNARRLEINKHGLFPVLYGSYSTYAEAQKVKNDVRESVNPEAWLLVESL